MANADETKELIRAVEQLMRDGTIIIGEQWALAADLHGAFVKLEDRREQFMQDHPRFVSPSPSFRAQF